METWFTADLHFGHQNIIDYCNRPFASVDHMNEGLVERWNAHVANEDTVYVLGDVAMGKLADSLDYVKYLNGKLLLVPGNHDKCWPGHRKRGPQSNVMYEEAGFEILEPQVIYNSDWLLCHFPASGDSHGFDRYVDFRPPMPWRFGEFIIHGHVHDSWKVNGRQINVGVDVWDYRPVHLTELCDLTESVTPSV